MTWFDYNIGLFVNEKVEKVDIDYLKELLILELGHPCVDVIIDPFLLMELMIKYIQYLTRRKQLFVRSSYDYYGYHRKEFWSGFMCIPISMWCSPEVNCKEVGMY